MQNKRSHQSAKSPLPMPNDVHHRAGAVLIFELELETGLVIVAVEPVEVDLSVNPAPKARQAGLAGHLEPSRPIGGDFEHSPSFVVIDPIRFPFQS